MWSWSDSAFVNVFLCMRLSPRQLWDIRKKGAIHTFQNTYQVLAVTFNDTSDQILSGGIDNDIKVLGFSVCREPGNDTELNTFWKDTFIQNDYKNYYEKSKLASHCNTNTYCECCMYYTH